MLDKKKLKSTHCLMAVNHTLKGKLVSVLSFKVFWGGRGGLVIASFLLSSQLFQNFFQLRNLRFASAKKEGGCTHSPASFALIMQNNFVWSCTETIQH